jgi:hypothetical protein
MDGSDKSLPGTPGKPAGSFSWSEKPEQGNDDLERPWQGITGEYELIYRTRSTPHTGNQGQEDGSRAAAWSNQDGYPQERQEKLTPSTDEP